MNRWLYTYSPGLRQALTRLSYELISILDRDNQVCFLNYGFDDQGACQEALPLPVEDEKNRHQIQLYHHIARVINWSGKSVLEVSSGRGGGAAFIMRHFRPQSVIGVDFSSKAIDFSNTYYSLDGLSFMHGDAEALSFPDQSFDVVINIEASFYYPHVERFYNHVARVLKPNGFFLYADMRYTEEAEAWQAQLASTGLQLLSQEDITLYVTRALALDHERNAQLIQRYVPPMLRGLFADIAGMTGAKLAHGVPQIGERLYRSYVLQKT